jgi:two-component system, cell cycle response regulator
MTVILTVDDSRLQRQGIAALLAPFLVEVIEAADGLEGLAQIRAHAPSLVLLDYNMPLLDGLGLLEQLRADPAIRRTPVILLTANATPALLATVARLGVRDYLLKPFEGAVLLAKIRRLLPLTPRAGTPAAPIPSE